MSPIVIGLSVGLAVVVLVTIGIFLYCFLWKKRRSGNNRRRHNFNTSFTNIRDKICHNTAGTSYSEQSTNQPTTADVEMSELCNSNRETRPLVEQESRVGETDRNTGKEGN